MCYQELKEIENSAHMLEYNELPTASTNKLFSVDSMGDDKTACVQKATE